MAEAAVEKKVANAAVQAPESRDLTFTPRVDILETDDEMLLMVDLPGVKPDEVDVRFENGELSLHGRRSAKHAGRPWLWEYETGSFHRAFRVTENVAADKIQAEIKNGVMILHLPKVEAVKPRRIAIKAG